MRRSRSGFTLIELMVVVAIIGILAAIAVPSYQRVVLRSKITEALVMLGNIKNAQLTHFMIHDCFEPTVATPAGPPTALPRPWASPPSGLPACNGAPKQLIDIGVQQDLGAVRFTYQCSASPGVGEFNCTAVGDLDESGVPYAEHMLCSDLNNDGAGIPAPSGVVCSFPWIITRVSVDMF